MHHTVRQRSLILAAAAIAMLLSALAPCGDACAQTVKPMYIIGTGAPPTAVVPAPIQLGAGQGAIDEAWKRNDITASWLRGTIEAQWMKAGGVKPHSSFDGVIMLDREDSAVRGQYTANWSAEGLTLANAAMEKMRSATHSAWPKAKVILYSPANTPVPSPYNLDADSLGLTWAQVEADIERRLNEGMMLASAAPAWRGYHGVAASAYLSSPAHVAYQMHHAIARGIRATNRATELILPHERPLALAISSDMYAEDMNIAAPAADTLIADEQQIALFRLCLQHADGLVIFAPYNVGQWRIDRLTRNMLIASGHITRPAPPIPPTTDPPLVPPVPPAPPVPPVVEPPAPPSPPQKQLIDSIKLSAGAIDLSRKEIISPDFGILADNGVVVSITLTDVNIDSTNYGLYAAPSTATKLTRVRIRSAGGGNAYCVRGQHTRYESVDSTFYADHSWRVYDCAGGFSKGDTFDVGQLRLGGGAINEWISPGVFKDFLFEDDAIAAREQVTIYAATRDVTFRRCDFAGTGKIFIDDGARNIRFEQCRNLPRIQHDANLTTAQAQARGIVIVP